jgi:hypothetical protein
MAHFLTGASMATVLADDDIGGEDGDRAEGNLRACRTKGHIRVPPQHFSLCL